MTIKLHCQTCLHYWGLGKCDAFPKGIPEDIISGSADHRKPFKGDNGIRFEPISKED